MKDELMELNRKINYILEEKEMPEDIKKKIEDIYQEYRNFYDEYLKRDITIASQGVASHNIEEYFEGNYIEAMATIQSKYREKCREKAEVIEIVLSTLESQKNKYEDKQIINTERDVLDKCIRNDKENYLYTNKVIDIVIDSIGNSRNQLFRNLELLGTTQQRMEYIDSRIKLIENSAKLKLGSIKTDFDIDDEQISKQIFFEYEQYKENEEKGKQQNESQNAHERFVSEYRVSEEELQVVKKVEEKDNVFIEKGYEDLPGDVIR